MGWGLDCLQSSDDRDWCARLLSSNEPWITLRRSQDAALALLEDPRKESYLVRQDGNRAGLLILDMNGPFAGYIQTICLEPAARGHGLGTAVLEWAEARIFRDSPNVFICVSSFNTGAQRLYARLGYQLVGTLTGFVVEEHDELLLRKTRGSWESRRIPS